MKVTISEKWFDAEVVSFSEKKNPSSGKRELFLEALIVPFNKISRNGVMYNKESIIKTHKMLEGKPLMHNHILDGADTFSRGEWIETRIEEDGMHGKAKVYDIARNKDYIEWLEASSNPRVSLQITGDAEQKKSKEEKYYQEAFPKDWLESSTVNVPGFNDAKSSLAVAMSEAFKGSENNMKEVARDIIANINGKKVVLTTSGSETKAIGEDGKKYIKVSGEWQRESIEIDMFEKLIEVRDNITKSDFFERLGEVKESLSESKHDIIGRKITDFDGKVLSLDNGVVLYSFNDIKKIIKESFATRTNLPKNQFEMPREEAKKNWNKIKAYLDSKIGTQGDDWKVLDGVGKFIIEFKDKGALIMFDTFIGKTIQTEVYATSSNWKLTDDKSDGTMVYQNNKNHLIAVVEPKGDKWRAGFGKEPNKMFDNKRDAIKHVMGRMKQFPESVDMFEKLSKVRKESFTKGVKLIGVKGVYKGVKALSLGGKTIRILDGKDKGYVGEVDNDVFKVEESFSEDRTTDVKQMSQLLKLSGFDQMAKDVLTTKDKKTMLKYVGIVRRDLVKRMNIIPSMKGSVPKVVELTDKIADNVNKDPSYK